MKKCKFFFIRFKKETLDSYILNMTRVFCKSKKEGAD